MHLFASKTRMQVGEGTKRFLGSVLKLTNANCKVIFDNVIPTGEEKVQKETGQIIPIHKQRSNYVIQLCPDQTNALPPQKILTCNSTYIVNNHDHSTPNQPKNDQEDNDEELLKSLFARLGAE